MVPVSIWYQQPHNFGSNPAVTRRWGFSALPNATRSPFLPDDDDTPARSANAMYGLMPDYTRPGLEDGGDNLTRTTVPQRTTTIGGGGNPFAGMQFTDCT